MSKTVHLKLDNRDPDLSRIREVARAARDGKMIVFPTETVYGIGGPMSVSKLNEKLAEIKGRPGDKPFSYHIGDRTMIDLLQVKRTPPLRYLAERFWPGPLTLLVYNKAGEKIGIRYPRQRVTAALINACGEPFIATSANKTGQNSPHTAAEAEAQLGERIDYLIDCGKTECQNDSTIVDLTVMPPVIVRAAADHEKIAAAVQKIESGKYPRKKILFVCTGNSCRSPMAEAWLIHEFKKCGREEEFEVSSCGVGARMGARATTEAVLVMKNREVDLTEHRSKPCSREEVADSDLIFAMGQEHADFLAGLMPDVRNRIKVLNIPDPIGMVLPVYEEVIDSIEKKLKAMWSEIIS